MRVPLPYTIPVGLVTDYILPALGLQKRSHPANPSNGILSLFGRGFDTFSGVVVNPVTAMQTAAVYTCVRILSETVGSLPLFLYCRLPDGGKLRATDHPLFFVLHNQPNPEMTPIEFKETLTSHVALWGNAYAEIERNNRGDVIALWVLRPDKMKVERVNGEIVYHYMLPNGNTVTLPSRLIFHLKGLTFNGLTGLSPIAQARNAIGLAVATEGYGSRFFANDARPGGVLQHPGKLSDKAYSNLQKNWERRHRGFTNAQRVAILEEGMTFEAIGVPPEDAQFLETRKYQKREIFGIYRIPPHMGADLEQATFSNIEQQSIEFVSYTMLPWLTRWEQGVNRDLLTEAEKRELFSEFLVNALLRGDIQSRYDAYWKGRQGGWLNANEIRAFENLNPIASGEEYWQPLNVVEARNLPLPALNGANPAKILPNPPKPLLPASSEEREQATQEKREKRSIRRRNLLQVDQIPVYEEILARIIRREINDILREAKRQFSTRDISVFLDWLTRFYNDHIDFVKRNMSPSMTAYMNAVTREVEDETQEAADVADFITSYIGTYAVRHISRNQARVVDVITNNVEDPLTALEELFDDWRLNRAEQMARDEANRGNNAVTKTAYVSIGVTLLRWVTVGKNCPYCTALSGRVVGVTQWFLPAGENFEAEGAETPLRITRNIGHPPAHRGCDCLIIATR